MGSMVAGVYTSPSQAQTLVNRWSFNGNLLDSSGNNNNGTLSGSGSSYVPGKFGQAISLASVDQIYTTTAVGLPWGSNADWTMNLWLYLY